MKKIISCYIISETSLGIQCAEQLLKEECQLLGVISNDKETQKWAQNRSIPFLASLEEFQILNPYKKFDYLFSIVNSQIIKKEILNFPRYCAINYHDAPLPKYAGVHATSWAILNNELNHGISWHIMNDFIDGGNILRQVIFPIEPDETALSLNLQCYTHALNTFKELIRDLVQGIIIGEAQDLKKRSYFPLFKQLPTFGFAFWNSSAENIYSQYRALKFGKYPNALGSSKILIGQKVYILTDLEVLPIQSQLDPGTIVNISNTKIRVSTETFDISLSNVRTLSGEKSTIENIVNETKISIGHQFKNPSVIFLKFLQDYSEDIARSEKFWKEKLSNATAAQLPFINSFSDLKKLTPTKKKRINYEIYAGKFLDSSKHLTKELNISFSDILISAFVIYLRQLGNSYPFSVGFVSTFLNNLPKDSQTIFPAYVPLTLSIPSSLNAEEIVRYIHEKLLTVEKNKAYFKDIFVRYPGLEAHYFDCPIIINRGSFRKIKEYLQEGVLLLNIDEEKEKYIFYIKGNLNEKEEIFIKNLNVNIKRLFNQIIKFPAQTLDNFSILTSRERYKLLDKWNQTDKEYPSDKTIHALFEEQVERAPDNIAVVYEDQSLTYKELNEHANQLANYLRQAHDIEPDTLIALCLDRSEHMLISLLAVLKAGAAYVPIDPSYPDERIQYVLKDTKTKIVLTNEIHKQKLNELSQTCGLKHKKSHHQIDILGIDSEVVQKQLSLQLASNPLTEVTSTNLAYVIYTSGSTGNPKGVMIEHRGVVNRIKWMNDTYPINETDKILQKTPYIFDVSVWELLWANWCGASIVFAKPEGHKDPGYIIDLMNKESITIVHFVPSILGVFQDTLKVDMGQLNKASPIPTLRYVFCSGEELKLTHVQECHNLLPSTEVHNLYGPTEASIDVLFYNCNDKNIEEVYIGNPISNTKAYVLGTDLELLPIGGIGELHIGGVGLARGYLNRPDLTAERFITNPFQSEEEKKLGKNARLYKTGDLVRWLADGNLEYIGRNDFQVKIRGYRIELGEIEAVLSNYAGIRQSVVIAKEQVGVDEVTTGNKYLVGYYVSEDKLAEEDILNYLKSKLPEYMVPTVLVHLEELPLTINGKLDRKALPEAELTNSESYVAPRNELESRVCQIWAEVLSLAEDKVGICDDYFGLGGNSILAIRLVSKLNKELNSSISVSAIFKNNTVDKLVRYLKHSNEDKVTIDEVSIDKVEEQSLSYAQERLWFIEKYEGGTNAYNVPMVFKLANNVKLDILERSIKSLVSRHEVLRTLIKEDEEGHGYQLVLDDKENPLEITKIKVTNREQLESELSKKVNHIYDLGNEYPIRVDFYELINNDLQGSTEYYLSIVIHHIAFDGWSSEIFLRELQEFYRHYLDQSQSLESHLNLPDLSIQYKDFALWQRSYLSGERLDKQLTYWKGKLSGYETLNLVTDKPRPSQIDYTGADIYFELDEETSRALRELAKELKVSLYSLLLSGYYLMLRSYSNQNDIVIGTPVANRHYSQIENLIGFFINSLALRIEISSKATVKEFIKQVGNEVVEAQLHQDLPFEKLVEELKVAKDNSRHPIFQVLFELHDFGSELQIQTREKPGINSTNLFQAYDTKTGLYNIAKFDLSTYMDNSQAKLRGCFNYAVNLYTETTITGFIETYSEILRQLARLVNDSQGQQTKIADVNYLTEERYNQVIYTWNQTDKEYPSDKTIHALFEEQVERAPDNIAVVYEDQSLTYKELNEHANQLANYLRQAHDIEPDTLIALCLDRSEHMLISLLAVLKAGAAYVPIDPSYPDERIQYVLKDTKTKIVLTNEIHKQKLNELSQTCGLKHKKSHHQIDILGIDSEVVQKQLSLQLASNPLTEVTSTNLAYVIYTSGSTGNPKGVMIEHRNIMRLFSATDSLYRFTNNDVWTLFHSYVFDFSVWEVWGALIYGGKLLIPTQEQIKDLNIFYALCKKENVTILNHTPTAFYQFADIAITKNIWDKLTNLRYVVFGGEALNLSQLSSWFNCYGYNQPKLINMYGITETTVHVTYKYIENQYVKEKSYIGKTIVDLKAYVLGTDLELLPIGGIGELHIGGVGLARGYLNRPDLTAERFITNPFQSEEEKKLGKNARLYKTGDLVRWLADGNLEYIGRNDFQVKIRGYRIELGEIEAVLSNYAGIRQSVVIAKEQVGVDEVTTGNKYLVGYYVSEDKLAEEDILNYLKSKLPEYMVPTVLVHLEELPLTINGKLDRKALPEAELTNSESYVAPRNELESRVCQIWAEVLSLAEDKVGICDDYFGLGGNSILAIRLVSKLNKELNSSISVSAIFKNNTVDKLVRYLKHSNEDKVTIDEVSIDKVEEQSLSYAQERLWFIEKYEGGTNAYNVPMVFKLANNVKLDILERSIKSLVSRHEVLRTLIKEDEEGHGYQLVLDDKENPLEITKIKVTNREQLESELSKKVNHIYDLGNEYPIRVDFYELINNDLQGSTEYYLSIVIHHIAFDGWSSEIFLRELQEFYRHYLDQSQSLESHLNLPDLSIQYKDFALWQRSYLSGERLDKQLTYWKGKLSGYETLNLVTDKPRPSQIDYTGADIYFELDEETSRALRELAKELKVSLYSLLLSGYYLMLRSYSNQNDIVIGTPVANRHYSQIENLIGFFINSLALRIEISSKATVKEFIKQVGNEVVEAQLHQDLPFEKLVEELKVAKDNSRHPIFQIMFGTEGFGVVLNKQNNAYSDFILTSLLQKYTTKFSKCSPAKFDISTFIDDSQSCLRGCFNYAVNLYTETTIKGFIETYQEILNQLAHINTDTKKLEKTKISDLNYLSQEKHNTIISTWNKTETISQDKLIHELFEEQVERTPENIAIVYEESQLTYKELNRQSNQLAHYIRKVNTDPEGIVAVCLKQPISMVMSMLATIKSSGTYLPIDHDYPEERINYILQDSKISLLITQEDLLNNFNAYVGNIVTLDTEWEKINKESKSNTKTINKLNNLAYVIYTSGSTGQPKGAMIEHKSLSNLIDSLSSLDSIESGDYFLQNVSFCFDPSMWTTLWPLIQGATLITTTSEKLKDPEYNIQCIKKYKIKTFHVGPSLFRMIFSQSEIRECLSLKNILGGGEAWNKEDINSIRKNLPGCHFINVYGPTETTIHVSTWTYRGQDIPSNTIPIGSPISNTSCYVLDWDMKLLPIGAIGELYVGGVGLARGYLNQPTLTAERFIPNPFQTVEEKLQNKNTRLYKTGDLVRWLADGNLEYIGRNDFQVKIRGYRIELGEIEAVLSNYAGIRQSVVIAKEQVGVDEVTTGNKYLVGYYVSEDKLAEEDILNYLKSKLPEYMVPTVLVHLEELPLTINGKLDRKALPEAELTNSESYVAPRNELESRVCQIWAETLGLNQTAIGIRDNFFDLGGNSILIIRLKSKIEKNLKIKDFRIADLFKYPTVKSFSDYLFKKDETLLTTDNINNFDIINNFSQEIAIVGMSGVFSGSSDLEEYWGNIVNGKECLETLSRDSCRESRVPEIKLNDKNFIPVSGVVRDIDKFDPSFWNISPNDASLLDPQIRKFLEHSWIALENSGYIREREEKKIGVFAGMSTSKYSENRIQRNNKFSSQINNWEIQSMSNKDFFSTKISYLLGLTGTSLNINTACSTSLVAVVEACKSLTLGVCDMALAGGASLPMPEDHGYVYQDGMILSKDGHCRVFDQNASGMVSGAGVGVVVLKRFQEAIANKDNIIAVIKGYATNNDGNRKVGYTAPSIIGQAECILKALNIAKVTSDMIEYVECHGTGTSLGDPIEIAALHDAFKASTKKDDYSCILGAVKANIGHADSAAGIAGVLKVCKMLQTRVMPPQIHFENQNPMLNLEKNNFKVITSKQGWISNNGLRRAGVSSFGIGGTNAHVILEEYKTCEDKVERNISNQYYILPISSKSIDSNNKYCSVLADYLYSNSKIKIADIAYTLQYKREYFNYRRVIVCKDKEDAIYQLKNIDAPVKFNQLNPDIIFMFPGQGMQYSDMAKGLYLTEPVFRKSIDECCIIISNITQINFKEYLYSSLNNQSNDHLKETQWSQPALFIICYSLAKLFESFGIIASSYIGHSIGEYVAATLSGVFKLEDALKVVIKRGELMQKMSKGNMMAINAPAEKISAILPDRLEIAVYNSPEHIVVSGEVYEIESFKTLLNKLNIPYSMLHTSHAFHSWTMDDAAKEFEQYLKDINLKTPDKIFISNVTGDFITNEQATSTHYWASHIRMPVLFSQGVSKLNDRFKNSIYIEVGPGKGLSTFVNYHKNEIGSLINSINTLPNAKEFYSDQVQDIQQFYKTIGKLWSFGYDITWSRVWKTNINTLKIADLPAYQFEKNKCWIDLPIVREEDKLKIKPSTEWLYQPTWKRVEKVFNPINVKLTKTYCWLIFRDKSRKLDSFINFLKENTQNVITVDYSESHKSIFFNERQIIINPYDEIHYMQLSDYITTNFNVSHIIHGWTISDVNHSLENNFFQYLGFYSIFLLQNNLFTKLKETTHFIILTNGLNQVTGKDIIHADKGTMLGAIRAIPHEIPRIKACVVDTGFDKEIANKYLLFFIMIENNYILEPNFSIRSGYLWKEEIDPIDIEVRGCAPLINDNDIILIPGGLGGIGLAVAKEISKHHRVKFVLASRNGIGSVGVARYKKFQLDSLNFIRSNNSEAETYCCDISKTKEVHKLINFIKEKHKKIDGIIHAAGSPPLVISERNLINIEDAIRAKVLGAKNLFEALRGDSLKFFVMSSSLASILGDVGRLEYCAANSYLDILSGLEASNINNLMSINWPGWFDVGMSLKENNTPTIRNSIKFGQGNALDVVANNNLTESEGAEIFYNLINQRGYKQVFVSKINILELKKELFGNIDNSDSCCNNIESNNILIEENTTELENKIALIFSQILGSQRLSKYGSYFELGGNSLSAIRLINKLNKELNSSITISTIFEKNTVFKLAEHVKTNLIAINEQSYLIVDEGEL